MEFVKRPIRAVTAPAAQRAYLTTFFLFGTSLTLLFFATLAYPIFYWTYVPKKLVSLPVHLQYNAGVNPYGITSLRQDLMYETAYDVSVELTLPRSPPNLDRGNFMIALFAMKSAPDNPANSWSVPANPYEHVTADNVVFSSRRPAFVPYIDPLVSTSSRLLFLPWHVFLPGSEQATLMIPMGELVEFRDELPLSILLDVRAGQTLQVYSARIELVARLGGIRWAMYNYKITCFFFFTGVFWLAEMTTMGIAWLVLGYCLLGRGKNKDALQQNPPAPVDGGNGFLQPVTVAGSDGSNTVVGSTPSPKVKQEDKGKGKIKEESVERSMSTMDSPRRPGTADADDEESTGFGEGTGTNFGLDKGLRRRPSQKGTL